MAQLFKALGDDTRLRVLELLSGGERCVCELQASLRIAQPLLSFHLRVLRDADLVADRRGGRWAYYSLRSQAIAGLGEAVDLIRLRADAAAEKTKCCA
jgi:ArsR family transcriptional regulator